MAGDVDEDRKDFHNLFGKIERDLKEIRDDIKSLIRGRQPAAVEGASPLKLTDLGERLADCLDAKAWAEREAGGLLPAAKGRQAFEIDAFCKEHVAVNLDETMQQKVQQCAYEVGMEIDLVFPVLRVVLRDELLQACGLLELTDLPTTVADPDTAPAP